MPSKNKFPFSGLSKQQKEILKYLNRNEIVRKQAISWYIAKIFDNEQDSRIEKRKNRSEIIEEMRQEYLNEDTTPERKKIIEADLEFMAYITPSRLNKKILSEKHRASMSRSLKRLRERGLIKGYSTVRWDWNTKPVSIKYKFSTELSVLIHYYGLTEKGLEYIKK